MYPRSVRVRALAVPRLFRAFSGTFHDPRNPRVTSMYAPRGIIGGLGWQRPPYNLRAEIGDSPVVWLAAGPDRLDLLISQISDVWSIL